MGGLTGVHQDDPQPAETQQGREGGRVVSGVSHMVRLGYVGVWGLWCLRGEAAYTVQHRHDTCTHTQDTDKVNLLLYQLQGT